MKRIEAWIAPDLSGLQRNYLQRIVEQCRFLPLRGIDFKSSDATCDMDERIGLSDVYIQLDTTAKEDQPPKGRRVKSGLTGDDDAKPLSAIQALLTHPHNVLLGHPGSGKSTFVNHLCMCLASNFIEPGAGWLKRLIDWPEGQGGLLPIPVILREMAAWLKAAKPAHTKVHLLMSYIQYWLEQRDLSEFYHELHARLRQGKAIFLLDGLDEVPVEEDIRARVLDAVADITSAFEKTPSLVTCRVLSYQDTRWRLSEKKWRQFELSPLNAEKIDAFISAWYRQLAIKGVVQDAEKPSQKLIQAVRRKDLASLAPNPLLLTVIALVNTHKGELPDTRAMLYEDVVDLLLWRWEAIKLESADGRTTSWRQLLEEAGLKDIDVKSSIWEAAYEVHDQAAGNEGGEEATADIPESKLHNTLRMLHPKRSLDWADSMVQAMKQRAGLLIEGRPGIYSFPHRTFQEYLAGCHLCRRDFTGTAVVLAKKGTYWWEAILLAIGRLVQLNAEIDKPLMLVNELCPEIASSQPDDVFWRNVWLAGRCLLEIGLDRAARRQLGQELQDRLRGRITALVTSGQLSPRERAEAGRVLGGLGDYRPGVRLKQGLPDIDWVTVEPGPFVMGSDKKLDLNAYEDEMPQFTCTLIKEPYRISRYPVTVAQYQAFVQAGGYQEQRFWTGEGWKWRTDKKISGPESFGGIFQTSNHPQVGLSWYEAAAFCRWLSEKLGHKVDLPTEAQWERAARHTDGRIFAWGNDFDASRCNMGGTGIGGTSAVGIFPDDRAVCGAMDMCGNVWEWCRTVYLENYKDYQTKVSDDLEGTAARVLRGGAFSFYRVGVRSANRNRFNPDLRLRNLGFRVVAPGL